MRKCRKESELSGREMWKKRLAERNGTVSRPHSGAQRTAKCRRSPRRTHLVSKLQVLGERTALADMSSVVQSPVP